MAVFCPYCDSETTWMTPNQVACGLGRPVQTIRRWLRGGRFPGAQIIVVSGRKVWRIPMTAVVPLALMSER